MTSASTRTILVCLTLVILAVSFGRAQTPILPSIPAFTTNILGAGAVGNGVFTNTTAIQNAINGASGVGGGTVEIPSGTFLCGPLTLNNNINLQLDSGATLLMLPMVSYPGTSPLITASGLSNLEISGSGTIDGQSSFASWWTNNPSLSTSQRPVLLSFSSVNRVLIQNITVKNPPSMHLIFKGSNGNITIQGITISTPSTSPNTDGIDLIGTTVVVNGCSISDGDDCIALGSTGGTSSGTLITNCAFGFGHGMSIGGNTAAGVSNLTVINCSFNGTEYGLRLKSDNATSSGGEGGLAQNLFYGNLRMTNLSEGAIVIYSYYNEVGTPTSISPTNAQFEPVASVLPTTCVWRNIIFSNITASVTSSGIAGIIWGRTEMPITNVLLKNINISAPKTFGVYNAHGIRFENSQIKVTGSSSKTLSLFNAEVTLTNSLPASEITNFTMSAYITNLSLPFSLYNASASSTNMDLFAANPITISGGTLGMSNNFIMPNADVFNFALGTNTSTVVVQGNLNFNNTTINVAGAAGFSAGTYTLFSYSGSEAGTYSLGTMPTNNFTYALTNTAGQIEFVAASTGPSLAPVTLAYTNSGGQLMLAWPQDHIGFYVQIQTNSLGRGLGTNWTTIPGSNGTNTFNLPVNLTNDSIFLRLMY